MLYPGLEENEIIVACLRILRAGQSARRIFFFEKRYFCEIKSCRDIFVDTCNDINATFTS